MVQFILSVVFAYCLIVLLFYFLQRHLIYFPSAEQGLSPALAGVSEMDIVLLHTADGLTLKAWYYSSPSPTTLVYFHGNAGHIGNRAQLVKPFLRAGYGVLLVTYRGYSGNPGKPSEEGLYQDGRAAMEFLIQNNIPSKNIVLYGESIGTAVAIQMATEYSVGAVVLHAPFPSLADVGQFHYPFIPVKWLIKDRFSSLKNAKKVHAPVLILHGANDIIVPPLFGQQVFKALSEPKRIEYLPHVGHNDLYEPARVIHFIQYALQLGHK
jgi:fermentation-respiration switch protein FrsA (DUF1100 family)